MKLPQTSGIPTKKGYRSRSPPLLRYVDSQFYRALIIEGLGRLPRCKKQELLVLGHPFLKSLVRRLERRTTLDFHDKEALASLEFRQKTYEPGSYIVREGTVPQESALIVTGFAFRQKLTQEGLRQIVSFHMSGDFVDLEGSLLNVTDHNVQALTRCDIAAISVKKIISLIDTHPRVGRALWVDTLIDASIHREWVMNLGRRPAKQRLAHLFCELAKRLKVAGAGDETGFYLPMTQDQLADAAGLTPVHTNRSLKALVEEGLIARDGKFIKIPDWKRLRDASGFSEVYLHLDQAA